MRIQPNQGTRNRIHCLRFGSLHAACAVAAADVIVGTSAYGISLQRKILAAIDT